MDPTSPAAGVAPRFFSLAEVAQHNTEKDCWVIVHDNVYNVSEYLLKHPGGYDLLWKHAGKDCTADFEGMFHSVKARNILQSLIIGQIQQSDRKATKGLNPYAARAMAMGASGGGSGPYGLGRPAAAVGADPFKIPTAPVSKRAQPPPIAQVIDQVSFRTFKLISSEDVSPDTKILRFAIPYDGKLNVPPGKHLIVSTVVDGKMTKREYTPISDETGFFELLVKRYQTGPISSFLHSRKIGDQVMMRGLFGTLNWDPDSFIKNHNRLVLIGAGSGITPLYQIITAFFKSSKLRDSSLKVSLVFANRTAKDVLLKDKIESIKSENPEKFTVTYLLSKPDGSEAFPFVAGRLDSQEVFEQVIGPLISTEDKPFVMLCGQDNFCSIIKGRLSAPDTPRVAAELIHVF